MGNTIVGHLKSKRSLLGLVALGGLLITAVSSINLSKTAGQLAQLGEGMQICFSRVGQSFTARMLGKMSSPYLEAGFLATTEECVGDVIYRVSNEFESTLGKSSKALNMLASNIHWFHERVNITEDNGLVKVSDIDIEQRFAGLEADVEEFIGRVDESRMSFSESSGYLQILLGLLALLAPFMFVWEFYEKRRLLQLNGFVEKEAMDELCKNDLINSERIRTIVSKALEQNQLVNCANLFHEFSLDLLDEKTSALMPVIYDEQKEFPVESTTSESIHLSGVFSDVVASLSDKLFSQEIFFDIDIDEDVHIESTKEATEQAIFYLISDTIKRFDASDIVKRILVKTKKLGGTTILTVEDSTKGFGEDFIVGMAELSLDLKICQEVAKEFSGTLILENLRNKNKEIKGSKVQLVFKSAVVRPVRPTERTKIELEA